MKGIERWVLGLFASVDNTILGFFTKIGPYITAAIPALLAGYGIASYFDSSFGMIIGFTVGIGMEAAGIKIIHTAIEYSDAHPGVKDTRFIMLVLAALLFDILVTITIYTADQAYPYMVRVIGGISPTLAAMAYFALGVERSLQREDSEKEEIKKLNADFERERKASLLEIERQKQAADLQRIQAETAAEIKRIKAKSEAEEQRLQALAEAEATRLRIQAEEQEHQRQIELQKLAQKHEKAMEKLQKASDASDSRSIGKPFRRYDEFHTAYTETQDLSEISAKMGVQIGTIRGYKRKYDAYRAKIDGLVSDDKMSQNSSEIEQASMNGQLN